MNYTHAKRRKIVHPGSATSGMRGLAAPKRRRTIELAPKGAAAKIATERFLRRLRKLQARADRRGLSRDYSAGKLFRQQQKGGY